MASGVTRALVAVVFALALSACAAFTGCEERPKAPAGTMAVEIGGRWFVLELATDDATRKKGLGGRESIAPDGGMLFSFRTPQLRTFVMRDCLVPVDIIFLDGAGYVTAVHHMPVEPPRGEGEGEAGDLNVAYDQRLTRYSSRAGAKYAIELAGGMVAELGVQAGDRIELDTEALARVTK